MLKIKKLELEDYVTYKEAIIEFNTGITVIHGKNLDRPEAGSSNGAGKSIVPGVIPSLRYGAAPLPLKARKNPKANFKKTTQQKLYVEDVHGNEFTIHKFFKGTTRLAVYKNGKNLKFREKDGAQKRFDKLIPQNEEQFYTLTYLDTKRPPILQYGTDAQRHHFIEALYKLNVYDDLGAIVKKDWEKTQVLIQEIAVLDRQLNEKSKFSNEDPEELKQEQARLLLKVESIRKKVSNLLSELQQCRTYLALVDGIDLTKDLTEVERTLKGLKSELKELRVEYNDGLESNKRREAYLDISKRRERLESELTELADVEVDKTIQERIKEDTQLLDEIEEAQENNRRNELALKQVEESLARINNIKESRKKQALEAGAEVLEKSIIKERTRIKDLEANLQDTKEHLLNHDSSNCPICDSELAKDIIDRIIEEKQASIDAIKLKVQSLKQMSAFAYLEAKRQALQDKLVEVGDAETVKQRIDKNKAALDKMRRKLILKGKLKELPEVEDAETIDLERVQTKIHSCEKHIRNYEKNRDSQVNLAKLDISFESLEEAEEKKAEIEEAIQKYQPLLDKIQEKLHKVSGNAARAESAVEDIKNLSSAISDLKIKTSDHKIKTALRKAFGAKGIRKQRVAEIGAAIETSLNDYARYIYDFPIRFELVVSDSKFEILAYRNGGVSDVRSLSGAESRAFSLLTLVSLLRFAPTNMRLDLVIADELEANMDESFRRRYVDVFLPELLKIVPKVVIITPLKEKEFFIPKAKVYVVTKKDNKSTLLRR